jgi:hypothetical protein
MPFEVVPPTSGCSEHSSRATTLRGPPSLILIFCARRIALLLARVGQPRAVPTGEQVGCSVKLCNSVVPNRQRSSSKRERQQLARAKEILALLMAGFTEE